MASHSVASLLTHAYHALVTGYHLTIPTRGHRLLEQVAQQITGPACCHWLVRDTQPAAAAASTAASPGQGITQELLAEQCARQQLQRVLEEAVTIRVSTSTAMQPKTQPRSLTCTYALRAN
jgi:hypothetical protein